ncbi:aldehyde dehydrogenase family protein [Clostridium sp. AM58-1XD]|uniref:aldehyde dehydrogenase family protein n=1 Tax=Clostridium sp. AM58-1XD TaxID=2292307 RepID=UPI000E4CE4C7|nr:aldehyde dehydrogenase family protein [Clostridium sp. AM58-1XD]RGY98273.1 aldehyde dehydrogenase family protein [Clostridium sp. AM58-1XD]
MFAKTVGVVEVDEAKQLVKIAKPVGVVASLVPTTVPMGVVFIGAMNAIMGRNATVFSPHPRAKKSTMLACEDIRKLLVNMGYPADLVVCIEEPSLEKTNSLMQQADLIVATGGKPMVKAAYSSGTPAFGVGAGNVVVVIDETADFRDAANKIMTAQLNDYAIGCSTENAMVIQQDVYQEMMKECVESGAYICNEEEKAKMQEFLWKAPGKLNPDAICLPAPVMAEKAGFKIPEDRQWIIVEESGYGPQYPFSGEKLSVIVTAYKYDTFDHAIELVNGIQAYSGAGHSCGIHSFNDEHIMEYAMRTHTSRVAVRMTVGTSNAGNWNNGMPFTINLGCGTWGGNITSENVTWKNYINTTWVAREIPNYTVPTDEELFGNIPDEKIFEGLI